MRELTADWGCSFVLASGSLARFWEVDDIVGDSNLRLPEIVPPDLVAPLREAEDRRVSFVSLGRMDRPEALAEAVAAAPGPRLLIMNTVQSAAVMARLMRMKGNDVLHLSTALAPRHRDAVLGIVKERLDSKRRYSENWTLVATSLMEAGVDISFRTPFRERFATTSLIQIGGRGNLWSPTRNLHAGDGERDLVCGAQRLPVAHAAAQLPTVANGIPLLRRLDAKRRRSSRAPGAIPALSPDRLHAAAPAARVRLSVRGAGKFVKF